MTPPRVKNSARQPLMRAHIPGVPPRPEEPGRPFRPSSPGIPLTPGAPDWFPSSPPEAPGPVPPTRAWLDPHADWKSKLYERLMAKRIVLASGFLDDDAAARLSAQLLTLDAEQKTPIRLELQNLRAELSAVLTVMGILDVLRVPVHACVSGEIAGPALGVLASCPRRSGYPNASFVLAEPKLHFGGTVTALTAREQQMTRMLDTLYFRLAEVTGREVDQIRDDARRGRTLTTAQAIGYGLIQNQEPASRPPRPGDHPHPGDQPRPGGPPGPAGPAGPFGPRPR
jgi:ATP-dependent Clp protease, protease subunit